MGRMAVTVGGVCVMAATLAGQQAVPAFEVACVRRNVSNARGHQEAFRLGGSSPSSTCLCGTYSATSSNSKMHN